MEWYHRVGGILPIRLANAYLLLSSAVLETKLRAFLGLPGKCSSNQDISLVLIFYILINSARLSFCKPRAVSFSFVMCGPVLWLTWLVLCRFFSCNLKLQRKHPIVEGCSWVASRALENQLHALRTHPYICLSLLELNSVAGNPEKFTNSFIDTALNLVISQTPIPATNSTLIQATDLVRTQVWNWGPILTPQSTKPCLASL